MGLLHFITGLNHMSIPSSDQEILFVNPYDTKGGASMGTYRLFSYFRQFISSRSRLLVIVKSSLDESAIEGLTLVFRIIFSLQAAFNKFICWLIANKQLPVAFTFFVPLSLPALAISLKARSGVSLYLHSMGSGFACPLTFYLLFRKASVVKTADDWYLTGGCHYSLECNQWKSGCASCPHVNVVGKLIVRFNWWYKRKVLFSSRDFVFISPSNWLSSRYKYLYPARSFVIYNSAYSHKVNEIPDDPCRDPARYRCIGNVSSNCSNSVSLGLPVTYLRDSRKGFLDALPFIVESLEGFPVRLLLCGGDSGYYLDMISSLISHLHPYSCVESLGPLRPKEMSFFYSKLDFVMHFARYDNSPNVVTESLCSGIPVIVLNNSGSPEHVLSSSAGFILDDLDQIVSIVSSVCNGFVDVPSLKKRAIQYSAEVLSSRAMATAYSRFLT